MLTAFHCIKTGLPAGTIVSHSVGASSESATAVSAALDPLRLFTGGAPDWEHDIAVLTLDHALTIPAGARDAALDDDSTTPTGDVDCVGAGAIVEGTGIGAGTLRTLTFPIITATPIAISLKGYPATTSQPGDSGGPCWSTKSHRIVGIFQSYNTKTYVNTLTRTNGATAAWIAFQAFKTDMFDPSSSQTFATTPAQWRTAKLDASTGRQIVGITASGLEIYTGTHTTGSPMVFSAAPPVSLTALPMTFTTPEVDFVDVTGDGLTDLVMPTASEIDVLRAAGANGFTFPAVTTSLGSSTWVPGAVQFGNVDGIAGKDYLWIDASGAWVNSTQVEVGTGWDLASTMADLNSDGMADGWEPCGGSADLDRAAGPPFRSGRLEASRSTRSARSTSGTGRLRILTW